MYLISTRLHLKSLLSWPVPNYINSILSLNWLPWNSWPNGLTAISYLCFFYMNREQHEDGTPAQTSSVKQRAALVLPLCSQRFDHCWEQSPIFCGHLGNVLGSPNVGLFNGLGQSGTSRTVTQWAGKVAAVACRHGNKEHPTPSETEPHSHDRPGIKQDKSNK